MMTDPVADLLTRLRNANARKAREVTMPASRLKVSIAQVLKDEGYIVGYKVEPAQPRSRLVLELKYGPDGERVIQTIRRVSKPGCRIYSRVAELAPVLRGMGIQILSTPRGVLSDRGARKERIGGEVLCHIT
jgi:small subunit ribosomal protein S8